MAAPLPGSFEYLEAKIRRDAAGTLFGRDFEWVCRWYLEHAPLYRGKFRRVWRWAEWPDRWGPDCGIDLVAETHDGNLWAIQAKAVGPDHSITKAEIDSFLAESNRPQIAFRLLIGTTDNIGANARRTIDEQAKHASVVLRGDLVSTDLVWPTRVGGAAPKPKRAKPRPHQRKAISDVLRGFRKHDRGRLIMACGTGKTLTGLWIHERLKSRRTLLLVPSISLVQQNLREWGRHAREDFDFLVVCSDESVTSDRDDPALRYIAELGIDVTTDAKDIAAFLAKRRRRPAVVIATYQSSNRVSDGQRRARKPFDLALCDEAHRLVGDMRGKFATILDVRKIRCRRRLFMTATPRYFTQRARQRAADEDLEVASMDDPALFGPEFHVLKFSDAINAKPMPLLTDYRVVVIGVTNAEAAQWVEKGKLVRTNEGAEGDARTLAAQIGLAKAMREYDLRRVITFHRSIARASRFVDDERRDSLPAIIEALRPASRPSGKLWARHISGETPASKRASMLRALAELPADTRGIIANCACLGEGVDVPALDGIAFIDPKGSMVDIIQAVGRVIRLSEDKSIGTIVLPVFIDESSDAEQALEQSAFDPVWQVLKAIRSHDQRLADELDNFRASQGGNAAPAKRVLISPNIILHIESGLLKDFERAFYVRAVKATSEGPALTEDQVLVWADMHRRVLRVWPTSTSPESPAPGETWRRIDQALRRGSRGLRGLSSLARLLAKERGVRNRKGLPPLTHDQILEWADHHRKVTGDWPTVYSGNLLAADETWRRINGNLVVGIRGLPGNSSLAQLLEEHRGVPNHLNKPRLRVQQILRWVDEHRDRTGQWPSIESGRVGDEDETWRGIHVALSKGGRGLRGGSSLPKLLAKYRSVRNRGDLPRLTVRQILAWADAFRREHGRWPTQASGDIGKTGESWASVNRSLVKGLRGLDGGKSLPQLLGKYRGYRHRNNQPLLTDRKILGWADRHFRRCGKWPTQGSGPVVGTKGEKWANVNSALVNGLRGLLGNRSLAELLAACRGVRNRATLPALTIPQILEWADDHKRRFGKWPLSTSGPISGTQERWNNVNAALVAGLRNLPGGSSLPRVLEEHRGVPNRLNKEPLTANKILAWANSHRTATGEWPNKGSGRVKDADESWGSINHCLVKGGRGLRGGSSLAKLLDNHHGQNR